MLYGQKPFVYTKYRQFVYQVCTKIILHIPNIDRNFLSVTHEYKLSIPHMEERLLSICNTENLSTCGTDKIFVSILGIDKLSILCIDNTSTYDVYNNKISTSQ